MAILKQIKFGNDVHQIAKTQVAVDSNGSSALSVSSAHTSESDADDPVYTLSLALDGKTIVTNNSNQLETALALKVLSGDSSAQTPTKDRISLVDSKGGSGFAELSSINIEDIVGEGIVDSATYDSTTGKLTIAWVGSGSDTEIDLGALLDIQDIVIKSDSTDFLSFAAIDPGTETGGQAQIGVKLADVAFAAASGGNPANLTVDTTNGKILDASDAIPAIKQYVNAQTTDLAVTAQGDNYITAAQDAEDNKKINVTADVQTLTATAGTPGQYGADGSQTTAPVAGTLSGTADSLADGADIATKVKTYVDGAIAIEAARSDAKNTADIKAAIEGLDFADTAVAGQVVTEVDETNGVIAPTRANLSGITLAGFTADPSATGAIAETDTVAAALNKLQNKADAITYQVSGTTLIFNGISQAGA